MYNGRGVDNVTDFDRIADVIKSSKPNLVALQELDSMTQRTNLFVAAELAKKTKMHYVFRPSFERRGGGTFGISVLSKEKPIRSWAGPLPGRDEARSLLIVEFKNYVFCCTHLSQVEESRLESIPLINEYVNEYMKGIDKPVIFGGDFNAVPSSATMTELTKSWTILNKLDEPTLSPAKPERLLDYVLIKSDRQAKVNSSEVINTQAAAWHMPVVVDIEI
jgi:endonuclease/exonuclease/phosphatase family metal-dependent hydrolase